MKTLVLSMISIAATVAAMTACTSEGDPIDNIDNGQPVEIQLNAGIGSITTKTPITSDDQGKLSSALPGIQFVKAADIAESPAWGDVSKVASTAEIKTDDISTGKISFNTPLYYNVDPTLKSWLIGYYPVAEVEPDASTNKGKLQWTITGKEDILLSAEVSGNKSKDEQIKSITFNHQLLQMQFKFVAEDPAAIDTWGNAIRRIAIKTKASGTLANLPSTITCTLSSTPSLAWSNPAELTAYAVTDGTYSDNKITEASPITLTETETLGGYIMVQPLTATTDYTLAITTNKSTAEVPITLGAAPAAGKAYEIILTFKASTIATTATITKWETVTGGTGTVQ